MVRARLRQLPALVGVLFSEELAPWCWCEELVLEELGLRWCWCRGAGACSCCSTSWPSSCE